MAFTYSDSLATNRDLIRFSMGDVVESAGPRPADGNFTDAEVDGLLTAGGSWQRAVAAGFERLAAEWTRYPSFKADGLSLNRSDIARGFREQAADWRKKYGTTTPVYVAGQITVDAYSDDVASDDVNTGGEYADSEFEYVRP